MGRDMPVLTYERISFWNIQDVIVSDQIETQVGHSEMAASFHVTKL